MTCKNCIHYDVCKDTVADENWTDITPVELREMFSPAGCRYFMSAADVAPVRHGKWKTVFRGENREKNLLECSECGSESPIKGKWCYECGAKMDGGNK